MANRPNASIAANHCQIIWIGWMRCCLPERNAVSAVALCARSVRMSPKNWNTFRTASQYAGLPALGWPAWCMCAASSWTSSSTPDRILPRESSNGSQNSTPLRRWSEANPPQYARSSAKNTQSRSSMIWRYGWLTNSPKSPAKHRSLQSSAMPSAACPKHVPELLPEIRTLP